MSHHTVPFLLAGRSGRLFIYLFKVQFPLISVSNLVRDFKKLLLLTNIAKIITWLISPVRILCVVDLRSNF